MKILLITFVFLLTTVVGCSSKLKKDNASAQSANANLPVKNESSSPSNNSTTADSKQPISDNKSLKELTCTRDSESRSLKVEESAPKGCKLMYSNFNPKQPVAWSSNGHKHCETVMERIKDKLEAASFKCQ